MSSNSNTRNIDAGNFGLGMVPDVIGAQDTVTDMVDGWVERLGSVRKRGGKAASIFDGSEPFLSTVDWTDATPTGAEEDVYMLVSSGGNHYISGPLWGGGEAKVGLDFVGGGWISAKYEDSLLFGSPRGIPGFVGAITSGVWSKINTATPGTLGVVDAEIIEQHDGRLWVVDTVDGKLRWSHVPDTGGYANFNPFAFLYVFPGVGGRTVGLHSWNDQLIVVKERAVFAVRGLVNDDGSGSIPTVDLISDSMGFTTIAGSRRSRVGVFIASTSGLFLYSGNQMVNLVDGVLRSKWGEIFELPDPNFPPIPAFGLEVPEFRVSTTERRVIIHARNKDDLTKDAVVIYDIEKKIFYRQSATQQAGFSTNGIVSEQDRGMIIDRDSEILYMLDWFEDYTDNNDNDVHDASIPRLSIETTALPAGRAPFQTGLPNNIFVTGYSDSPLSIDLLPGRDDFETALEAEYKFKIQTLDDTQRIPLGGVPSRPMFRIKVEQDDGASNIRVYGIGFGVLEDRTIEASRP